MQVVLSPPDVGKPQGLAAVVTPLVVQLVGHVVGSPETVHRLEELGLRGGATIEMVQNGSPCIIRLAGQKLCFRADELVNVMVRGVAS